MAVVNVATWRDWVSCGVRIQRPCNGSLFKLWSGPSPLKRPRPDFGVILGENETMTDRVFLQLRNEHRIALALDKATSFVAISSA